MDRRMKSLLSKSMTRFIACIVMLFALAAPAFYYLTKNYYAEDMQDLIEAVQSGRGVPPLDLEQDIMKGIMLQYVLITVLLAVGVTLTMRLVSKKLWRPFSQTLDKIEAFRLEKEEVPALPQSDVKEFNMLNSSLHRLMAKSVDSYRAQKEFTENASHELQTPLAIFQAKLEILLQQPELTERQAEIIHDLFQMTSRLSRLNRNLLLLAKIENSQYDLNENINLDAFVDQLMPSLETVSGQLHIIRQHPQQPVYVRANSALLESLVNNLFVNAVRHNIPGGTIKVSVDAETFSVENTSDEPSLSPSHIFNRFYRPVQNKGGNGLGLAIAKAICDCHGWKIRYTYSDGLHCFTVDFSQNFGYHIGTC